MNAKQEAFVREYLIDLNATQAAIRAGYSKKTARAIGAENLTKPYIKTAINREIDKRAARTEINADRVIKELAALGFADTTLAIRVKRGRVVVTDTDKLSESTRRAISEIKQTINVTGGASISIKFHDKKGPLQLLGQHLGIFEDEGQPDTPSPTVVNVKIVDGRKV